MDAADLDVWILAGQSNMQGYGLLAGALPPDERVWNFTSAGRWEIAEEPLQRLWESYTPVHIDYYRQVFPQCAGKTDEECAREEAERRVVGAGLGISFGSAMAEGLGRPVGLIPCAHGGSSLEDWTPARKGEGGSSLYGAMLDRVRRAGGRLRGLLWYQGESDATPELAPTYARRLDAWIAAARADLGRPDLPVLAVQLARYQAGPGNPANPGWDEVREAIASLPARVAHTWATSAIDLGLDDPIHLSAGSLIRLGKRLARLALHSIRHPDRAAGPRVARLEYDHAPPGTGLGVVRAICDGLEGGWAPSDNLSGFSVHTPDGQPHPRLHVFNASVSAAAPDTIRLGLSAQATEPLAIAYGLGLSPHCALADRADMPLCAFKPRRVSIG